MKKYLYILIMVSICLISKEGWCPSVGGGAIGGPVSFVGIPQVSSQVVTANTAYIDNLIYNGGAIGDQFVKIDQSVPQTVVSGRPIFDTGIAFDDSTHYLIPSGGDTLKLYLASTLVHTWHVTLANEYILLETGVDFALLENGAKIILE